MTKPRRRMEGARTQKKRKKKRVKFRPRHQVFGLSSCHILVLKFFSLVFGNFSERWIYDRNRVCENK